MEFARLTAKGQATVPERIREAIRLREGDLLAFDVEGDRVIVRRVAQRPDDELNALQATLSEWSSAEDDEAWRDL